MSAETHLKPETAAAMVHDGAPVALIDLREAGQFGEGHPLFAIPLPYSRLELAAPMLLPWRGERILLLDASDGVSERAADRLRAMGYDRVSIVAGGAPAWEAAGLTLFKGVNVPSKTLGELAEHVWHPQMISATDLAVWQAEGRNFAFVDARPKAEYAKMRVPGSTCLPNGELAHRAAAAVPHTARPLVITCAGRTRGITGVIGMMLAGWPGEVMALENGTQGWTLAGETLERGNGPDDFPALDETAMAASRDAADRIMARFGIVRIDADLAEREFADQGHTIYLFDTRSAEEAQADPLPGAVHAPSGQLAQASDQWIAVRHARVILCCDTGLRSALAAFWLVQLGFDVAVLRLTDAVRAVPALTPDAPAPTPPATIDAAAALDAVARGATLIDLRHSQDYRAAHAAGAVWGIRPRLYALVGDHQIRSAILIAPDTDIAALAAIDLSAAGVRDVMIVRGGQDAMISAGARVDATADPPADEECIDHLFFVHDRHDGNLDSARRYLAWETGLIDQLSAQERAEFRLFGPEQD